MSTQTVTINGFKFTIAIETDGVSVKVTKRKKTIGEVFVDVHEVTEGKPQAHVFHGESEEPTSVTF